MSGPPATARGRLRRRLDGRSVLAKLESLLGGGGREQVHGTRDDARPSGLVARAEPRAVVAVEVFVEQDEIAPVRVLLEPAGAAVHRPAPIHVTQEDVAQTVRDFLGDLIERHVPAGAGGTFDGEPIAVVEVDRKSTRL